MRNNATRVHGLPVALVLAFFIALSGLATMAAAPKVAFADDGEWTPWADQWRGHNEHLVLDTAVAPVVGVVTATFEQWQIHDDQAPHCAPQYNEEADVAIGGLATHHFGDGVAAVQVQSATLTAEVGPGSYELTSDWAGGPGEPGCKGNGSYMVRVRWEFTPNPVEPVCTGWSVSPATGYAPLAVSGSGSYTDPDGLVEEVRVIWGDGDVTANPADLGSVPHTYQVGTHESQLVLVKADGGLVTSAACSATVEAVEAPVLEFDVQVGASCKDHVLRGWVRGSASQEATLNVSAAVFGGTEIGGAKMVGPGTFDFSAQRGGFEGLVEVKIDATLMYEGDVVDEDHFSSVLDCGTTPQPDPGQCQAAAVSVANVPDSGAMTAVTAQVVGDLAEITVNGQPAGQAVPVNGTATFEVFVRPNDIISVVVRGEDDVWVSSPACQLTIAGEPEQCPDSAVSLWFYQDRNENGYWEYTGKHPYYGGEVYFSQDGEPGADQVYGRLPYDGGHFDGRAQNDGHVFSVRFSTAQTFNAPDGGLDENGSPLPFVDAAGNQLRVTGVTQLYTDETGTQVPAQFPIYRSGRCDALVLLVGLAPAIQPVAEAAPAWGGNAPASEIAVGAPTVGSVTVGGQTVEMTEVWGSDTSDWHQCGLRRDRALVGCHVTDNVGNAGPGNALLSYQVGDTIEMVVDGQTVTLVVTGRTIVDRGPDWANRLDAVEAAAGGSAMTFFTCSGWDGEGYTTFTVLTTAPAG